ncbi:MAG: aspartate--tRNA ligase [Solobacterium sp.]|nr:aspartate--tRNA ligase [Solobacterium sp.]MDY2953666.1 aspartate--tRNA ligase [Erysipelotrichaceae bacterium]MCI6847155.1 aspartate--tRNA ligase [Solobacterium sp.]MCI7157449.1 aspartate--tRNA ligase [Solobacterium sp.]MDD7775391.1 aspartate--tRNA ligase [Solobacterium sp.]
MYRTHTCGQLRKDDVGKTVELAGWVSKRRNLGSIVFIDLRDRYGITQITFDEAHTEAIKDVRNEYVLWVKGEVSAKEVPNPKLETGEIEVLVKEVKVLNSSKTTPMIIADETDALEDLRLKYRYLDLRRPVLQKNLILRDKVTTIFRRVLHDHDFIEVETPILSKSTPEGARDYLVPSRLYNGKFYALPQSPQIYKQLLMISGMDRYFQIARCFRDEDLRADRQPEFTQIDMEMSFASEEDLFAIVEDCMHEVFKELKGIELERFPRIRYLDAMEKYGSDKPDLRFEMLQHNVTELFRNSEFSVFKTNLENNGVIKAIKVDNHSFSRKETDKFSEFVKIYKAKGVAFVKYENNDFTGGIAKFLSDDEKNALKNEFSLSENDTLLFVADKKSVADVALGALRCKVAKELGLIDENKFCFAWIVEFPMYEWSDDRQRYEAASNPFSCPRDEDIAKLEDDKGNCFSRAYDLVLNGYELSSGAIRIHDQDVQAKVFKALGLSEEQAKERFGFFLDAFQYGMPPECGCGIGLERLIMILCGTDNIKDVVAFPKTATAYDLMADAPGNVDQEQLDALDLIVKEK